MPVEVGITSRRFSSAGSENQCTLRGRISAGYWPVWPPESGVFSCPGGGNEGGHSFTTNCLGHVTPSVDRALGRLGGADFARGLGCGDLELFTVAALVRARQIFFPAACHRNPAEFSRAFTSAATTANSHSSGDSMNRRTPNAAAHAKRTSALSRSRAVEKGSAGRRRHRPAVLGGSPSTAPPGFCPHLSVTRKREAGSRRRAGDDRTRAACGPHSTAELRPGGRMPFKMERARLPGRRLPDGLPPVISNDGQT
jgi:hypothetical protein